MSLERKPLNGAQAELIGKALDNHNRASIERDRAQEHVKQLVRAFGFPDSQLAGFDTETRELILEVPDKKEEEVKKDDEQVSSS